jgi:hypothetical protein
LPNWEIQSSEIPVLATRVLQFGSQIASNSRVQLRTDAERETCSIESLDQGWLFLFTPEEHRAHLIVLVKASASDGTP